ncbi:hypothetical protein [Nocardia terpenica]|uniref:hypothetical protein n=1 Tax=Nocardia terpenica TaxID=455432 RepID=UPI0002FA32E3|nr:hypothetical protein [Nocardia terpenica]NQE89584.1 hypothetical protein [Nocardia terpenica]
MNPISELRENEIRHNNNLLTSRALRGTHREMINSDRLQQTHMIASLDIGHAMPSEPTPQLQTTLRRIPELDQQQRRISRI